MTAHTNDLPPHPSTNLGDQAMAAPAALASARPQRVAASPDVPPVGLAAVVRIDSRVSTAPARTSAAQFRRRRLIAILAVVTLVFLGAMTARAAGASPTQPDPIVGGHAVVEPGMTLWDVAVANAPADEDVRAYLHDLRQLNGIGGDVAAWAVVALPPR